MDHVMHQRSVLATAILMSLVLSSSLLISHVTAQDLTSDRRLIQVMLVEGNATSLNVNENFSNAEIFLRETNPDLGLGLNLTVRSGLTSEDNLNGTALVIISMPVPTTNLNTTILQEFLNQGGSLLLMSNFGGGSRNSSKILNDILRETYIRNVSFGKDAIFVGNNTLNWQERVYGNNTLAVRVNSSMFHLETEAGSVTNDVSEVVIISCRLNVTYQDNTAIVGTAQAFSNSALSDWLMLFDNGINRITVSGSASMFNNTYLNAQSNKALFRNLILWLVGKFQMVSPDVFPYVTIISSVVLVTGLVIYAWSKRRGV